MKPTNAELKRTVEIGKKMIEIMGEYNPNNLEIMFIIMGITTAFIEKNNPPPIAIEFMKTAFDKD